MALMGTGEFHGTFFYSTIRLARKDLKISVLIPSGNWNFRAVIFSNEALSHTLHVFFLSWGFVIVVCGNLNETDSPTLEENHARSPC